MASAMINGTCRKLKTSHTLHEAIDQNPPWVGLQVNDGEGYIDLFLTIDQLADLHAECGVAIQEYLGRFPVPQKAEQSADPFATPELGEAGA